MRSFRPAYNPPKTVLLKPWSLLVDLQQKVGELVLSISSCLSIITLENALNYCI
jgi:hypothetical protein